MPPCRAAVHRSAEVSDGAVAAPEKNLRIGNICPFSQSYFLRRWIAFKIAFYFFVVHAANLGKKPRSSKGRKETWRLICCGFIRFSSNVLIANCMRFAKSRPHFNALRIFL